MGIGWKTSGPVIILCFAPMGCWRISPILICFSYCGRMMRGAIDIVKGFQQFCFEKTRDNYSMYLIKVGAAEPAGTAGSAGDAFEAVTEDGPVEAEAPVARKKTRKLLWGLMGLLLVMIAAAAFFIKENYFSPAKPIDVLVPVSRSGIRRSA